MKTRFSFCVALGGAALLAMIASPLSSRGQAGAAPGTDPATAALLAEIGAQQTLLTENQTKIDEKIALIAEDVRQARLFVARGGGTPKSK